MQIRTNKIDIISQGEIADIIGISRCYYSQVLRKTRRISIPIAKKVALIIDKEWNEVIIMKPSEIDLAIREILAQQKLSPFSIN